MQKFNAFQRRKPVIHSDDDNKFYILCYTTEAMYRDWNYNYEYIKRVLWKKGCLQGVRI